VGDLTNVAEADRAVGALSGAAQGRDENGHEQGDDADHDEQLNEREARPLARGTDSSSNSKEIELLPSGMWDAPSHIAVG